MKVEQVMTKNVIWVGENEPASVAARSLAQYNLGALPVRGKNGGICGMVTDRDLVIRCMAAGLNPDTTPVKKLMTRQLLSVPPSMEAESAGCLMGLKGIRRLPVVEEGKLCGILSLGDLAENPETAEMAGQALGGISSKLTDEIR